MGRMVNALANYFLSDGDGGSTFERPGAWLVNSLTGSTPTRSGIRVSSDKARQIAAVYAAIRNISEDLAKIPLKVYERTERGKIQNDTTPAARVIARPNTDLTPFSFRESLVAMCLGWGNGFAEIVRDKSDRPRALELIHPSRVKPQRTENGLVYYVHTGDMDMLGLTGMAGDWIPVPQRDMIHVRGHGDDILGKSAIREGAESMGIAIAAQEQAATFFSNGMSPSGVFVHPNDLNEKARTNLREYLQKTYGGSKNAGKQLVLWGGIQYQKISVDPGDAQLLETRLFQIQEIARWFRMPLSKLQENTHSTFSNTEQESLAYIVDTLHAWSVRIEQEFQRKLFTPSESKYFVRHKLQALVRGDMKTRGEFYKTLFNIGALSPDQVLELEDMNTIGSAASSATYMQSGMTTIDHIFEGNNLKNATPETEEPDETSETEDDMEDETDETDVPRGTPPQGMKAALSGLVERCLTRQHRACANNQKKDAKNHKAWASKFFNDERAIMQQALGPVVNEICAATGNTNDDFIYMIREHCRDSAARGEPANTVNELTDQLLRSLYD